MVEFQWTKKRIIAAKALADGKTREEAAKEALIGAATLYRWLAVPEFAEEVDRLTLLTGIAVRAERLRIAKRTVARMAERTEKDLLDWLKFAQSETDGSRSDIADKLAAIVAAAAGEG